jgi:hypothetical protein
MGLVHQTYPLTRQISLGEAINPSAMRPQSLTLMLFCGPEAPTAKLSWFPAPECHYESFLCQYLPTDEDISIIFEFESKCRVQVRGVVPTIDRKKRA